MGHKMTQQRLSCSSDKKKMQVWALCKLIVHFFFLLMDTTCRPQVLLFINTSSRYLRSEVYTAAIIMGEINNYILEIAKHTRTSASLRTRICSRHFPATKQNCRNTSKMAEVEDALNLEEIPNVHDL